MRSQSKAQYIGDQVACDSPNSAIITSCGCPESTVLAAPVAIVQYLAYIIYECICVELSCIVPYTRQLSWWCPAVGEVHLQLYMEPVLGHLNVIKQ